MPFDESRLPPRALGSYKRPVPAVLASKSVVRAWLVVLALMLGGGAAAQPAAPPAPIVSPGDALIADAVEYARQYGVPLDEAVLRLRAQEESVPAVDAIAALYRERLAGIVLEHVPAFRFVVTLTGAEAVPDQSIAAAGMAVPIHFQTDAPATRDAILAAIAAHQADLRAALRHPPGMGVDARTGMLAVMVHPDDLAADGADALGARLTAIAGLAVEARTWGALDADEAVEGGGRVSGIDPADGRRYVCTTGFVVTDGTRTGIVTAAHCPDDLRFIEDGLDPVPLQLAGAWGARYQDVQIHVADRDFSALFHPDTAKAVTRPLTSWRNRASTRAGDFVCHRGERTGYSCAEVAFVDYAPPGDLCAGPCPATWVAVRGPTCKGGDSGGPIFLGTIAFGIVKGGTYTSDGTCRLYYYMSTDYLPPPWTLAHQP